MSKMNDIGIRIKYHVIRNFFLLLLVLFFVASANAETINIISIAQARSTTGVVTVTGYINSIMGKTAYIQDATSNPTAGIAVINSDKVALSVGDEIQVSGEVSTYKGQARITAGGKNISVVSKNNTISPKEVKIADVTENIQGQYVRLKNIEIVSINNKDLSEVKDETGSTVVYLMPIVEGMKTGDIVTVEGVVHTYEIVELYIDSPGKIIKSEKIDASAQVMESNARTGIFSFMSDDKNLKVELEDTRLTEMPVREDATASGGTCVLLESEVSKAEFEVAFPAGTYQVLVNENAPSGDNDAFYVAADGVYFRNYVSSPPIGSWELTSRTAFALTYDAPTTVKFVVQQNAPTRSGENGMTLDFVKFIKIRDGEVPIQKARTAEGKVTVTGYINTQIGKTVYIQDKPTNPTAAIAVINQDKVALSTGDEIEVTGEVSTYKGQVRITAIGTDIRIVSKGNAIVPKIVKAKDITEQIQGQFVALENVEIVSINNKDLSEVKDSTGSTVIYQMPSLKGIAVGDTVAVSGVVHIYDIVELFIDSPEKIVKTDSASTGTATTTAAATTAAASSGDTADRTKRPYKVTVTFNGDTKTSKAFTWYTTNDIPNSEVQVVEKSGGPPNFNAARTYTGSAYVAKNSTNPLNKDYKDELAHKVVVTGLKHGTEYWYRVGDGAKKTWSEPAVFKTADKSDKAFTFINITDTQIESADENKYVVNTMKEAAVLFNDSEFILHVGDFVQSGTREQQWDWLLDGNKNILMNSTIAPVPGNHEFSGFAFVDHFKLAMIDDQNHDSGAYYSFDYGNVHFTVLNTNNNIYNTYGGPLRDEQLAWLRNDVRASEKTWKILVLHTGVYTVGPNLHNKEIIELRNQLVPIIDELDIDIVFQGHDHTYSRTKFISANEVADAEYTVKSVNGNLIRYATDPTGTVYITTNTAGPKAYALVKESDSVDLLKYHSLFDAFDQPAMKHGTEADGDPKRGVVQHFAGITVDGNKLTYQAYMIEKGITSYYDGFGIIKEGSRSADEFCRYTVKEGDFLSKIAPYFNTTWQRLQSMNDIKNPDLIFPGQELVVPSE